MAKNMAFVENGIITNIIWCSDHTPATDTLIDPTGRRIGIGDTYTDGKFYRDGVEVLTEVEELQAECVQLKTENLALVSDMASMVEEIYQSDVQTIGL
jgi:hypothetical protein